MYVTVSDFPAKGNALTSREIANLALLAEQCGVDRFGVTDFPFHQDCLVQMAACLMATNTIAVESLVTTPYLRGPDITAAAWATLAELSGGRAILGIGKGGAEPPVFAGERGFGRPPALASVRDMVRICRQMWRGEAPSINGEVLHTSGRPLDMPVPHHIPILIAARGPQMLQLAGELADIVHVAAPFLGPAYIRDRIDAVLRGGASAQRPAGSFEIDLTISLSVGADVARAREAGELTTAAAILWLSGVQGGSGRSSQPAEFNVPAATVEAIHRGWNMWTGEPLPNDVRRRLTDDVLDQFTVWGDTGTCVQRVAAIVEQVPEVTGVRFKLPPLFDSRSYRQFQEMIVLIGDITDHLKRMPARVSASEGPSK